MRHQRINRVVVSLFLLFLCSCGAAEAPQGRWEGFSSSADWIVAVRLQVDSGNVIHATALSIRVSGTSLPERLNLTHKIKAMLPGAWADAPKGKVDFKDNTLRRAGGVAPLFVFDPRHRTMSFSFYAGGKLTEHIKLYPVKKFMVTS
ncbi:MAG: hypothetical protein ABL973_10550 [Micropepsaceae bacterium]